MQEAAAASGEEGQRWIDHYGPVLAGQLDPGHRYSVVKVGIAEFAYTSYDGCVRALQQIWSAGLMPQSLRSVASSKLLEIAPNLRALDADLSGLQASDVERSSRFS